MRFLYYFDVIIAIGLIAGGMTNMLMFILWNSWFNLPVAVGAFAMFVISTRYRIMGGV